MVALHPEGVDRNAPGWLLVASIFASPSTRRAWIEIPRHDTCARPYNGGSPSTRRAWIEMMYIVSTAEEEIKVALHPEGVDRNPSSISVLTIQWMSPSTRRAWIEIPCRPAPFGNISAVALHPEGVDRNAALLHRQRVKCVALHPEGVDRNRIDISF